MGPMMNNPLFQMINIARTGGNPMQLMQQMARSNPQINQVMQMMNGKSPDQLRAMCENMCRERGTTVEQVAQQIGIPIPGRK